MEEWKEYKIGDICRIKHGFAFKGIHFVDEPQRYVCVTPGNFALKGGFKNDKPKYYNGPIPEDYILQKDDLVVTMTDLSKNGDTLGYSALIPYDEHYTFLHNQRIGLIEDISTYIDKHFLYWVMRTYDYQRYIVGHCSGSTVKHTSPSGIGSYVFRCPDLKMQKEISSVLDNLDNKIEVNRRINENLEQQAQALFKSWFVDFEPFRDQPFVESELGMIPEGWRVGTIGDICTTNKRSYNGKYSKPILYLDTGGITKNRIDSLQSLNPETDKIPSRARRAVTEGDIVYSSVRPILCHHGFLYKPPSDLVVSTGFIVITANWSGYRYFIYQFLVQDDVTGKLHAIAEQSVSTYPSINAGDIEKLKVAIPPKDVVEKFAEVNQTIIASITHSQEESRCLAQLRDTLLPRLMSGELSVDGLKGQFAVSPGRCPGSNEHVSNKTAL